jgi:hypothetical protein
MKHSLFLMFNHTLTDEQVRGAREALGIDRIVEMPKELKERWGRIPPEVPKIAGFLEPFEKWLEENACKGDTVLVQGDFGACHLMVGHALKRGLTPVYATTRREAKEEVSDDGRVTVTHCFKHVIFRRYGE